MSDQSLIRGSELTNRETLNRRTILIGLSIVLVGLPAVLIGTWIAFAPVLAASATTAKWVLKADYIGLAEYDLSSVFTMRYM